MAAYELPSDQEIIAGCIRCERRFQKALYDRFSSKMYSVCMRYAGDSNKADDLMQEGFIKVYKNIGKFRGEGSFEGWVRRIFVNACIEQFRKNTTLYAIQETEVKGYEYYGDNALEQLKEEDILKMVSELSPGYRTVFNMYVIEGFAHKEIGEMLDISEGTSKSQLARARYLLQRKITDRARVNLGDEISDAI
jgi:RNA polymerase sigma factor (sigma-70 family)